VLATVSYQPTTERVVDRGTLGLSFADSKPGAAISDVVLRATGDVPAHAKAQRFSAETLLQADTSFVAIAPDLQSGATSLEVAAKKPDGSTDVLLFAKDIPSDWPTPYIFKDVVSEPRGTRVEVVAYYENPNAAARAGGFVTHLSTFRQGPTPIQSTTRRTAPVSPAASAAKRYDLRGKVVSVDKAGGKITVDHQAIPGLMGAMTMAYSVKDSSVLAKLSPGDAISGKVAVSGGQYSLENIAIASKPAK
jgi:Cu/Ag efflux protein CusF